MHPLREVRLTGIEYLDAVTTLLQRVRAAHPTFGLYEAADFQWWWREPRATDDLPQLFWFDASGQPEAAAIATAWSDRVAVDPVVLPGGPIGEVMRRGLAHAAELGLGNIGFEVDPGEGELCALLEAHGFVADADDGIVEAWLEADRHPPVSPLADGYGLATRAHTAGRPHHMISDRRGHGDPELRLRQTSLYRPDLDLVVLDDRNEVAAYGLFWHDPTTATGLVEPMRTEDEHQRRGLARHVLTAGVARLAEAGAERIKICYEPDNPASGHLYRSIGFEPHRRTVTYRRS
jgi:GNAT superfamily N-acetyltransferase